MLFEIMSLANRVFKSQSSLNPISMSIFFTIKDYSFPKRDTVSKQ